MFLLRFHRLVWLPGLHIAGGDASKMSSTLELDQTPSGQPQTYTTSGLLLREIYEYLARTDQSSLTPRTLLDDVYSKIMRAKYGRGFYDVTLRSDGGVYSRGLADDVGILEAAGYLSIDSEGRLCLTAQGRRRAESIQPPP